MSVGCRIVLAVVATALWGAEAARLKRRQGGVKVVAGVPIYYGNTKLVPQGSAKLAAQVSVEQAEEWVFVVKKGVSNKQLHDLCAELECKFEGHPDEKGIPVFVVMATESQVTKLIKSSPSYLSFVEGTVECEAMEEARGEQARGDQTGSDLWFMKRIGLPNGNDGEYQGKGVNIYVFDTGVRTTHTAFEGRARSALDMSTGRLRDPNGLLKKCDGIAGCAGDENGHGTHVAGSAAGRSWGTAPQANLFAVKTLQDSGRGHMSWNEVALDWMIVNAESPRVASISIASRGKFKSMEVAVDAAVNAGITVVVAAGNYKDKGSNARGYTPAYIESALTVGSINQEDQRSSFSNMGGAVNIWAPGSDILSCGYEDDSSTRLSSGSSMATPLVSGAAAVLLSANKRMTPKDVRDKLLKKAERNAIGGFKWWYDDVNILLWMGDGPAPVPAPTPEPPRD